MNNLSYDLLFFASMGLVLGSFCGVITAFTITAPISLQWDPVHPNNVPIVESYVEPVIAESSLIDGNEWLKQFSDSDFQRVFNDKSGLKPDTAGTDIPPEVNLTDANAWLDSFPDSDFQRPFTPPAPGETETVVCPYVLEDIPRINQSMIDFYEFLKGLS